MRPQGVSNAQATAMLRAAFEKYIATCRKQGRTDQAEAANTIYRSRFDAKNYQTQLLMERQADAEIIAALQTYADDPTIRQAEDRRWAAETIQILSEDRP
jgi:regulator of protease activity HflC (stomatin/prohibitin superfamily)